MKVYIKDVSNPMGELVEVLLIDEFDNGQVLLHKDNSYFLTLKEYLYTEEDYIKQKEENYKIKLDIFKKFIRFENLNKETIERMIKDIYANNKQ